VTLPAEWLDEYLEAEGLGARLVIMAGRFPMPPASLEAALELSLEAYWLFQRFHLPRTLEERILDSVDALEGELLVRMSGPSCSPPGFELWSTGTRAELLSVIRAAWSRAYAPTVGSVPVWPTIAIVGRSSLSPDELLNIDRWSERLPDGQHQSMIPEDLARMLDEAERGTVGMDEAGAYIRYAFGCSYNGVLAPADPFEFLKLLGPVDASAEALRERYLALSLASGKATGQAYLDLATRSLELHASAPRKEPLRSGALEALAPASPGLREEKVIAQQLIGSPSSPGRSAGTVRHVPGTSGTEARAPAEPAVLVCECFVREYLSLRPVAVIESRGGRLGSGALLARAAGIPCVSGVRDAGLLQEGATVRVDGWLGLVSVAAPGTTAARL